MHHHQNALSFFLTLCSCYSETGIANVASKSRARVTAFTAVFRDGDGENVFSAPAAAIQAEGTLTCHQDGAETLGGGGRQKQTPAAGAASGERLCVCVSLSVHCP
jgi:hypothetical protein